MKLAIIIIAAAIALAGCDNNREPVKPITVRGEPLRRPNLVLPKVDPYRAKKVEWTVITPENADRIFSELSAQGRPMALFTVDEDGYKNLAINTRESLRVIMQQQAVINGYRRYYIQTDNIISEYNKNLENQ